MAKLVSNYRININADPGDIYDYLADFSRHGEWSENLKVEAVSEGPLAKGSEYRSVGRLMGRDIQNSIRVVDCERPSRLSFTASDGKTEFLQEIKLSPSNDGTLLERRVSTEMNPLLLVVFKALIGPLVADPSMNKSLKSLKERMEKSRS